MCDELNRVHLCSHDMTGKVSEALHENVMEHVLEQRKQV